MARRRGRDEPNALVAAAKRIPIGEKGAASGAARKQPWQGEAWAYFDEVPEVKEPVTYRGGQLAKLRLFIAVDNPDDPSADPIPASDPASGVPGPVAQAAADELARMHGEYGGQGAILAEYDMNQTVVGECYLVGRGEHTVRRKVRGTEEMIDELVPEDWQIRSISEVRVEGDDYVIKDDPGQQEGVKLDPDRDTIMRIWTRHPQWSALADSPMRALLGECRTLQVLTQQVLAQAMRSVSAGFFAVPNELSFGPADPARAESQNEPDVDPLNQAMNDVLVRPIDDPSDPSTVQPGIFRGAAEFLQPQYLRHIKFYDPALDTVLEDKIEARVQRIARGLNLPVEKIMGHQQTTFANAKQVDQDEFNDYLRPSADAACDALTYAFLVPQLREAGVDEAWTDGSLFIWYDASELIAEPDKEANADAAFDRFAISFDAYRDAKGFSPDDAPDETETLIRAGLRRGILTGDLTLALLELMQEITVDTPAEVVAEGDQPTGPPQNAEGDDGARARILAALRAATDQPVTQHRNLIDVDEVIEAIEQWPGPRAIAAARTPNYGARLMEIDRDLRTRVVTAAGAAMDRALEKAGAVLRSKANGTVHAAALRKQPKGQGFAYLGQSLVAEVLDGADPLAGAWDELREQFMSWGGNAQAQALDVAGQVAAGFTTSERSALQLRQAEDLGEAWRWMEDSLDSLAKARMFDAGSLVQDLGEFDPNAKVPTGLVRTAIGRAGGATGLSTSDGSAWLSMVDAGTKPAGGIGTGELLRGAMRDNGAGTEGYVWVYGPAFRQHPFQPHLSLDGIEFRNFDDDVLANTEGFPEFAFYMPGDHAGCICDFEPIIIPASSATAEAGSAEQFGYDSLDTKVGQLRALDDELTAQGYPADGPMREMFQDPHGNRVAVLRDKDGTISGAAGYEVDKRGKDITLRQMRAHGGEGRGTELLRGIVKEADDAGYNMEVTGALETAKPFYSKTGAVFESPSGLRGEWTPNTRRRFASGEDHIFGWDAEHNVTGGGTWDPIIKRRIAPEGE